MIRYTAEEKEFLRQYIPGHSYKDIHAEFVKRFRPITVEQVHAYCQNRKIPTGRGGQFKKGQTPWNKGKHFRAGGRSVETQFKPGHISKKWRPVGSERVNREGYIEIKVAEPNVWDLKHRVVWMQHNGPIPEGGLIVFKDKNRQNVEIGNLALISRQINARLTKMGLQDSGEAFDTAILVARLSEEVKRRKDGRFDKQAEGD